MVGVPKFNIFSLLLLTTFALCTPISTFVGYDVGESRVEYDVG